jgi:hypothetical protein
MKHRVLDVTGILQDCSANSTDLLVIPMPLSTLVVVTMTELDRLLQQESNSRRNKSVQLSDRRTADQRNIVALVTSDFPETVLHLELLQALYPTHESV